MKEGHAPVYIGRALNPLNSLFLATIKIIGSRGKSTAIRVDSGPKLVGDGLMEWATSHLST